MEESLWTLMVAMDSTCDGQSLTIHVHNIHTHFHEYLWMLHFIVENWTSNNYGHTQLVHVPLHKWSRSQKMELDHAHTHTHTHTHTSFLHVRVNKHACTTPLPKIGTSYQVAAKRWIILTARRLAHRHTALFKIM